jgi:hypothetical protein
VDLYNLCGPFRMVGCFYHYRCSAKAKTCLCIPPCAIPGMGNPRDRIDDNFSSGSYYFVYRTFHNSNSDDARRAGISARGLVSIWSLAESNRAGLQPHIAIRYRFAS